jgi:hypothetical protein
MLEILAFIGILSAIGSRARQRGATNHIFVITTGVGFIVLYLLSIAILGYIGFLLRWLWLGIMFIGVKHATARGRKVEESWRCPDCTMFNDSSTLRCLCGYTHHDARDLVGDAEEDTAIDGPSVPM